MSRFKGTLSGARGGKITAFKDESTTYFKSLVPVKTAPVEYDGSYDLTLPAGTFILQIRTVGKYYPDVKVTSTAGTTTTTIPVTGERPKGQPTDPATTVGGGENAAMSPSKSRAEILADTLGQTSATKINVSGKDVSGGGYTPSLEAGNIIKTGTSPGQGAYRSETTLPTSTYVRAQEGHRVTTEFELNLSGAFSDQPPTSWNVVFQMHGRLWGQTWPQPPVELNFQSGSYRLSSSSHAPNAEGVSVPAFHEALPRLWIPQPVGTWHLWKISSVLGGAGSGFVDVWCDGEQVVHQWFPKSGTMYVQPEVPGQAKPNGQGTMSDFSHEWIYTKIGLYGSGSHTKHRVVQHRNVRFTVMGTNNTTTYTM